MARTDVDDDEQRSRRRRRLGPDRRLNGGALAGQRFTSLIAHGHLSTPDRVGLAVTIGFIGGIGINTAHELGHKRESHERWMAKIALAQSFLRPLIHPRSRARVLARYAPTGRPPNLPGVSDVSDIPDAPDPGRPTAGGDRLPSPGTVSLGAGQAVRCPKRGYLYDPGAPADTALGPTEDGQRGG